MDSQAQKSRIAEEILVKKARLAELRKNREMRDQEMRGNRLTATERLDVSFIPPTV
jgi:hypothetical protein